MASTKYDLRTAVQEWARDPAVLGVSGLVSVNLDTMAERFNTTRHQMKAVLDSLSAEDGTGFHKVNGNTWSYNHAEWTDANKRKHPNRKTMDRNVRNNAYAYMMRQGINTLHTVTEVATAIGALNASTSAALRYMDQRDFIPVTRESQGVYRRVPGPEIPGVEIPEEDNELANPGPAELREMQEDYEASERERLGASSAELTNAELLRDLERYSSQPARPNPALLDELRRETEEDHPTPKLEQTLASPPPWDEDSWPSGGNWLRMLPPTRSGIRLAEDEKGEVYEVTPLRRT